MRLMLEFLVWDFRILEALVGFRGFSRSQQDFRGFIRSQQDFSGFSRSQQDLVVLVGLSRILEVV